MTCAACVKMRYYRAKLPVSQAHYSKYCKPVEKWKLQRFVRIVPRFKMGILLIEEPLAGPL